MATKRGARRKRQATEKKARPNLNARLSLLSSNQLVQIRSAVLMVLWQTGVRIDDLETRKMLIATGDCKEGTDGFIHFNADIIERSLETTPKEVRLYDRSGNMKVHTSGRSLGFAPGLNCPNILDHITGEIRPFLLDDVRNVGKLCQKLEMIDVAASLGYDSEASADVEAPQTLRALIEQTEKPVLFIGHDEVEVEVMWGMLAQEVGGWDNLAEKPCGIDLTGPLSPLRLSDETCRRVRMAARYNVPTACYPAIFPGMSSPVTMAGTIVQACVESIAGIVINQLERPGAPILTGSSVLPMDMRQADLAYGSPEYALANAAAVQFLSYMEIPAWNGGGCSDAHSVDQQAASEIGANMLSAALSGATFIKNLGMLSGGKTGSLEMLLLGHEMAGWVSRYGANITVDANTIAAEVIQQSATDNTFIQSSHTQDNYLAEMWMPPLFQRNDKDAWLEAGAKDMHQRCLDTLNDLL
jgi:trimethylamine---corrinoid protein Co-methyltransferase